MKTDNYRSQILRVSSTNEFLKKQNSIQSDAAKKCYQFKKSASQPAYFLQKSSLKKTPEIFKASSLQKLTKVNSLHKFSSPPQKKNFFNNNGSFKRQTFMNALNLNKGLQNNEKTKRLRLERTNEHHNNTIQQASTENEVTFFVSQIEKLQQITNLTIQKSFVDQYEQFFNSLKEEGFDNKVNATQLKSLVPRFCQYMQVCQQKMIKINQNKLKSKYEKIQMDFSTTHVELKKKTFKMQLLIREINQIKNHSLKISSQLSELKQEKKSFNLSQKRAKQSNNKFQITNTFQLRVEKEQTQIQTPINQQNLNFPSKASRHESSSSNNKIIKVTNHNSFPEKQTQQPEQSQLQIQTNEHLQMIRKIRELQKKQNDLVKTLLVLKSEGVDVQKTFQQVISGHVQDVSDLDFNLLKQRMPKYVREIQNKDFYDADISIIQSIDGLTARHYAGQLDEQQIFYPIKHQYKSKPLNSQMQKKLKLNFDVLYEDQSCSDDQTKKSF